MAKAEAQAAQGVPLNEPPKKTGRKKRLFLIALALVLIIGAGAAALMVIMQPAGEATEETAAAENAPPAKPPVFLALEPFVVNLRGEDGDNYLRLGVVLEGSDKDALEEAKLQLPRIRNGILLLLSSKTSDELSTMDGKQRLMQEIIVEARKPMTLPAPSKGIESVYFSDFVIQ